jgi:hypothetical protein
MTMADNSPDTLKIAKAERAASAPGTRRYHIAGLLQQLGHEHPQAMVRAAEPAERTLLGALTALGEAGVPEAFGCINAAERIAALERQAAEDPDVIDARARAEAHAAQLRNTRAEVDAAESRLADLDGQLRVALAEAGDVAAVEEGIAEVESQRRKLMGRATALAGIVADAEGVVARTERDTFAALIAEDRAELAAAYEYARAASEAENARHRATLADLETKRRMIAGELRAVSELPPSHALPDLATAVAVPAGDVGVIADEWTDDTNTD